MIQHSFQNPNEYKNHSSLQYEFAHIMLKDASLKKSDKILDIGTGDGRIAKDMANMVPNGQVVGTDISTEMIQSATRDHVPNSKTNLGFMVMEADKNIFRNQFDIVTSFCCLHWVKNQLEALKGIKNALVPNGKAILLVPLRHEELYTAIDSVVASDRWSNYLSGFVNPHIFFTQEKYSILLEQSGLEKQNMQENIMQYHFNTKLSMELFLKAWLPHMKYIPNEKHEAFLSDIGDAFLRIAPTIDNKIIMPLRMLKVHAVRPQKALTNVVDLRIPDYRNTLFSSTRNILNNYSEANIQKTRSFTK